MGSAQSRTSSRNENAVVVYHPTTTNNVFSVIRKSLVQLFEMMRFRLSYSFIDSELETFQSLEKRRWILANQMEEFVSALQVEYEDVRELLENQVATTDMKTKRIKRHLQCASFEPAEQLNTSIWTLIDDYQEFHDDLRHKRYRITESDDQATKVCASCSFAGIAWLTKDDVQDGMDFLDKNKHHMEELVKGMQKVRDLEHESIMRTQHEDFECFEPSVISRFQMFIQKCNEVKELTRNY